MTFSIQSSPRFGASHAASKRTAKETGKKQAAETATEKLASKIMASKQLDAITIAGKSHDADSSLADVLKDIHTLTPPLTPINRVDTGIFIGNLAIRLFGQRWSEDPQNRATIDKAVDQLVALKVLRPRSFGHPDYKIFMTPAGRKIAEQLKAAEPQ